MVPLSLKTITFLLFCFSYIQLFPIRSVGSPHFFSTSYCPVPFLLPSLIIRPPHLIEPAITVCEPNRINVAIIEILVVRIFITFSSDTSKSWVLFLGNGVSEFRQNQYSIFYYEMTSTAQTINKRIYY
jgi:hypothetical protein